MAQDDYPVIGDQNSLMTAPGPGAAMANNLQSILAMQRAQKQQDLINSLNQNKFNLDQQNVQSEIASRADTNATNKTIRDAQAAAANQTVADKKARDDRFKASSDYLKNTYFNSPEYAALPAESKMVWQLASTNPDDLEKAVAMRLTPQAKTDPRVPMKVFDEASGTFKTAIDDKGAPILGGENERPIIRSRPPVAPTPTVQSTFQTPDGETLINMNKLDAQGKPIIMKLDGSRYTGPAVKPDNKADTGIPSGELTKINGLRVGNPNHVPPIPSATTTHGSSFWHPFDGVDVPPDPNAVIAWRQAAIGAVANKKLPTRVMEAYTSVINNPDVEKFTSPEIVAFPSFSDFTPQEKATLERYLTAVRGN